MGRDVDRELKKRRRWILLLDLLLPPNLLDLLLEHHLDHLGSEDRNLLDHL